jgi:phosphatidylglycerol:prolipoprotein diacylglycerol transferase
MLPYIQIGPLRLWTYGLMLAWGLWQGYYFFRDDVKRRQLPVDPALLMILIAVGGVVGAKLYHVVVTLVFTEHEPRAWRDLFSLTGLAWNGGLIAGFAVLVLYARAKRVPVLALLDAASPAAAVGYAFGRMGCFLAGDGDYGKPTSLPWGMSFPHGVVPTLQRVHPTPLYEIAGAVLLFAVLRRLARYDFPMGTVFAVYLLVSGVFRFAVEFIRINPPVLWGLTEAQVVSLAAIVCGGALLVHSAARTRALQAVH